MDVHSYDPQLIDAGAKPYRLGTMGFWFAKDSTGSYDTRRVDLSVMEDLITKFGDEPTTMLIDIEAYDLAANHEYAVEQLRLAASAWRAGTDRPLGFYGLIPERNWWSPIRRHNAIINNDGHVRRKEYAAWQSRNTRTAASLLDGIDFLCPSIYAFYPDQWTNWRVYAEANLDEAARVANGKPIWPILYPILSDGTAIPLRDWNMMVDWTATHPAVSALMTYTPSGMPAVPEWRIPLLSVLEDNA